MIAATGILRPAASDISHIRDEDAGRDAPANARRSLWIQGAKPSWLRPALSPQHIESLLHMELAATAPVADAVGLEAEGSYLQRKDACTECMERPCRHKHEVAFLYRDAAPIALADRVVCCGRTQSPDIVCRRSEYDGRTRICRQDVPGLRLLVVVLMCLGIRLIGMYLHGEVLGSIHREHLHDARIACTLPHDLFSMLVDELVERHPVEGASLDHVHESLMYRDVERLAVPDIRLEASRLIDSRT